MEGFHNSQNIEYKNPFGAVEASGKVFLRLDVHDPVQGLICYVRLWHDELGARLIPMTCEKWGSTAVFSAEITMPEEGCLVWYSFVLENFERRLFYGNNEGNMGGVGKMYSSNPISYQITVYEPSKTPDWYKEGIAYQIFPDSFNRGKDWAQRAADSVRPGHKGPKKLLQMDWDDTPFYLREENGCIERWAGYGGTLLGIKEKLPYLKDLGITVLYLNPIFEAASNHRYDTADYLKIDPGLGDEEGFKDLVREAKKCGIHIILDGVFNHVGVDSIYFNGFGNYGEGGAAQSKDSPYYKWFNFSHWPDQYDCWWGVTDLPQVNETEPSYREFIVTGKDSVIRHWMRTGIDGFRLDVADELPDEFIQDIKTVMKEENPDSVLMGEVWEDASNKISYGKKRKYFFGKELDSVMNYPFRDNSIAFMKGKISAGEFVRDLMSQMENYPKENFYGNFNLIGSHDRERVLTLLGDAPDKEELTESEKEKFRLSPEKRELAVKRLKLLSLMEFTMPGIPCIYYGDEAGMEGYADPFNRAGYPWGREDKEIQDHYRFLIKLRKESPIFSRGEYLPVALSEQVYSCIRKYEEEEIAVVINRNIFGNEHVSLAAKTPKALDLLTGNTLEASEGKLDLDLAPLGSCVLKFIQ